MPGATVKVRRAGLDDLEALSPLFDAYRGFYQLPSDLPASAGFLEDRLSGGDSVIFVAEENGSLLGFVQLYPLFSSLACRRLWLLNDLYTAQPARRRGVARALMEVARDHAIETGASGIELSTAHSNLPAQRLYESLGYVMDQTFRVYSLKL
jgi:ribosomal protein S18 acetylase RimI-like enzyme